MEKLTISVVIVTVKMVKPPVVIIRERLEKVAPSSVANEN